MADSPARYSYTSPEQSGSSCLIRLRVECREQLVLEEKKGLKELLTHLNSHPSTRTYTPWAVTCEITTLLVRFVSEELYQLLNVPWWQVSNDEKSRHLLYAHTYKAENSKDSANKRNRMLNKLLDKLTFHCQPHCCICTNYSKHLAVSLNLFS